MLTSLLRLAKRWVMPAVALSSQVPPCVPEWCDAMAETQSAIWWKVKPYTMTSVERVVALCQSIAYLERREIPGAIVECGVWKGGSMLAAALALESIGATNRELYLFDTFAGMTEPGDLDVDWQGRSARELLRLRSAEGDLYRANASLDEVKQTLMQSRYPWEKLRFVQGKVEDTIPFYAPSQIALLRLDTDWHGSTRHELEHLYPRLVDGGILIIDDYGHWQGAKHAVDGYFRDHGIDADLRTIDFTGRLLMKKAAVPTMARAAKQGQPVTLTSTTILRLLNLGCGRRFHPDWTNLDLHPCDSTVVPWDVHKPLPFPDGSFDAVYHSHLLEHLPADGAVDFLRECRRVLTPDGIVRIAVPDLEAIAQLYIKSINAAWDGDRESLLNHRWLVTELFDQTTRETPGGTIAKQAHGNEPLSTLAWFRLGEDGAILRQSVERHPAPPTWRDRLRGWVFGSWRERLIRWLLRDEYALLQVGRFRRSGEIHHWMYDRVSLRTLLHQAGFVNFRCVSAHDSAIDGWTSYHLDTNEDGSIRKPDSLYVEAQA